MPKRRKHSPWIAPEKIDAQMGFYKTALEGDDMASKLVKISHKTANYLRMIVCADLKMREDARVHAHSHGDVGYMDPNMNKAADFLENLELAPVADE